jgi:hypothetical protein
MGNQVIFCLAFFDMHSLHTKLKAKTFQINHERKRDANGTKNE